MRKQERNTKDEERKKGKIMKEREKNEKKREKKKYRNLMYNGKPKG